jgi:putative endonuclease
MQRLTHYEKGLRAEEKALFFLESKGYECLSKRYKRKGGEIDLIVKKQDVLIFVEVRLRKNIFDAGESITIQKQERLTSVATHFIIQELQGRGYSYYRFDVVLIDQKGTIVHIENAFEVKE